MNARQTTHVVPAGPNAATGSTTEGREDRRPLAALLLLPAGG